MCGFYVHASLPEDDDNDIPDGNFCFCCQRFLDDSCFYQPKLDLNNGLLEHLHNEWDTYDRRLHPYCIECVENHHVIVKRTFQKQLHGFVYLASTDSGYKIGASIDPLNRVKNLQGFGNPKLIHFFRSQNRFRSEKHLHLIFCHRYIRRELFSLSNNDVLFFQEIPA